MLTAAIRFAFALVAANLAGAGNAKVFAFAGIGNLGNLFLIANDSANFAARFVTAATFAAAIAGIGRSGTGAKQRGHGKQHGQLRHRHFLLGGRKFLGNLPWGVAKPWRAPAPVKLASALVRQRYSRNPSALRPSNHRAQRIWNFLASGIAGKIGACHAAKDRKTACDAWPLRKLRNRSGGGKIYRVGRFAFPARTLIIDQTRDDACEAGGAPTILPLRVVAAEVRI
jgi:hypothetical protein